MKISITLDEIRKKFNLPEDAEISIERNRIDSLPNTPQSCYPTPIERWSKLLTNHQREKLKSIYPSRTIHAIDNIIIELNAIFDKKSSFKEMIEQIEFVFTSRDLNHKLFWNMINLL